VSTDWRTRVEAAESMTSALSADVTEIRRERQRERLASVLYLRGRDRVRHEITNREA